jgi:dTDP-glucose 4,6-dehydratase
MHKTLQWYLDHEPWWRAVMDGSYRQWLVRQYGTERVQERVGQA